MDAEAQSKEALAIQQALVEHLIESGVMDAEEFKHVLVKTQKKLGVEPSNDALDFLKEKPSHQPAAAATVYSQSDVGTAKILIVDNVKFIRDLIRNTLSSYGYHHFFEGENGYEAVEIFNREQPHLVLMDIEMKGMNGLEALAEIRKTCSKTPVIIMTGNPTQDYVKVAIKHGMTDFIAKPLDVNRVLEVIRSRLGH